MIGMLFPEAAGEGAEGLGGQWVRGIQAETTVPARRTYSLDSPSAFRARREGQSCRLWRSGRERPVSTWVGTGHRRVFRLGPTPCRQSTRRQRRRALVRVIRGSTQYTCVVAPERRRRACKFRDCSWYNLPALLSCRRCPRGSEPTEASTCWTTRSRGAAGKKCKEGCYTGDVSQSFGLDYDSQGSPSPISTRRGKCSRHPDQTSLLSALDLPGSPPMRRPRRGRDSREAPP